jgi:hypothetical protein
VFLNNSCQKDFAISTVMDCGYGRPSRSELITTYGMGSRRVFKRSDGMGNQIFWRTNFYFYLVHVYVRALAYARACVHDSVCVKMNILNKFGAPIFIFT